MGNNKQGDEKVTIALSEYEELLEAEATLSLLYAGGVDNWEGYEAALEQED